jgi:hypothetical protein
LAGGAFSATLVLMRVLAALLLPVAVLLPAAYVGHRLSEEKPPSIRPSAVVWANRVFVDRNALQAWLEARGGSYDAWAFRHPKLAWPAVERTTHAASPQVAANAQATVDHTARLLIGAMLALAAGVVLAVLVASPPYGLVRVARRRAPPRLPRPSRPTRTQAPNAARATLSAALVSARRGITRGSAIGVSTAHGALVAVPRGTGRRTTSRIIEAVQVALPEAALAVQRVRHKHPELGWYLAGMLLAGAVGVLLPYSLH